MAGGGIPCPGRIPAADGFAGGAAAAAGRDRNPEAAQRGDRQRPVRLFRQGVPDREYLFLIAGGGDDVHGGPGRAVAEWFSYKLLPHRH